MEGVLLLLLLVSSLSHFQLTYTLLRRVIIHPACCLPKIYKIRMKNANWISFLDCSGEGSSAKGPDLKVWNKGKGLENVSLHEHPSFNLSDYGNIGGLAVCRILLSSNHHLEVVEVGL